MKNYLSRKEKIKIKAIEIIFHEGLQELSVKNIAEKENIAPSLLYKYYQGMDELLKEVIGELGKFDARIYQSIKISKADAKTKILNFIATLAEYYQNYPEVTPLLNSYEFFRSNPMLEEEIYTLLMNQRQYITDFIIEGVKDKTFSGDIDPQIYATILVGALREGIFQWQVALQKGGIKEPSLKLDLERITQNILSEMDN